MPPPFDSQGAYYSQAPQVQQHEIGRIRQFIMELEWQQSNLFSQLTLLGTRLVTPEDRLRYVNLLAQYHQNQDSLNQHGTVLQEMLALLPVEQGRVQISDQVKREIYHLYHASRYTQEALASQYGISQSSVQRIVTGPAPAPLNGVNTASLG
ncbi:MULTISPECIES: hypothetical protein [Alcaligenes]|uniref:hypothetical protein n=1 Tax=Alcaligenes TaxID=507 RepID=UPI0002AA9F19|nr:MULTISPECIES: hypothetical protein [Alcaligenes]EKU30136.1 hypothetical protein C660_10082 [Alcaligenes sp. HPC1271]ERI35012.1 hypothetical protein N879_05685 [Alcaligenes sp. EGD-AK7]HRO20797.1 hypothetical protein [Alcaligenes phenolicus]HRP13629.1 hypothetical protein [Alcaligenes phenolicus]